MTEKIIPPDEVYASLTSQINEDLVQRVVNCFSVAINNKIKAVHLFMFSPGGMIPAAVAIYNFLSNIPIDLITYNGGYVASSAVLIYLAGKVRRASPNSTFLIHESTLQFSGPMNAEFLKVRSSSVERDNEIVESILRKHISIHNPKGRILGNIDQIIGAEEAKSIKLTHEIADFVLPPGNQLFNI